ncbi:ABC transporter transmembrane region [Anaerosporobacter mobilis DSM 15930]|jgi:ABC-type bacteriocin/lantibiotic exporter with double-glycine peptidase domain|uniref:ABC transporter transmembrane region n=1 Tax=Anaerosporobacter mobilis DSM 15930 TaxID=1120996 RepID=A0A1M7KKM8_9FIRM|nr:ABC transporter transmembrane domain-containing protein [Anaerosporobacter mobilis]SHM65697.1 ABC transporter transmembrane region [Anaerosporobacter mobilis DSM 15930]
MLDKLKRIFNIPIKKYIVKEFKCFVFLIIYTVATLLLPTFVSKIIDKGITQKNLRLATLYSIGMLATGVIVVIFQYLQQTSFYKLGQELTMCN